MNFQKKEIEVGVKMFEKIVALKILDPRTGKISTVFIKNAEEYTEIFNNLYVVSCIIKEEDAYVFMDLPPEWKTYNCPSVCLTKEEKEVFETMLVEQTDDEFVEGAYKGSFKLSLYKGNTLRYLELLVKQLIKKMQKKKCFYYGDNTVYLDQEEADFFEKQFEAPALTRTYRSKEK